MTDEVRRSLEANGGLRDGEVLKPLLQMTPEEVREVYWKFRESSTAPCPFETDPQYWSPAWKPKKKNETDAETGNDTSASEEDEESNIGFDVEALFGKSDIDEVLRDLGADEDPEDDDVPSDPEAVNS